ncbi:MAG: glycosyltransferase [Caldilineae bacterium]|nr:MAG: glycosyltransferase [Caldilineae bacterium]
MISLIIPTRNRRARLLRCLDAVAAQTHPATDIEVVVVDDASTDGTPLAVKSWRVARQPPFPVKVISLPRRRGAATARNAGIAASGGAWLAFLDDDCLPRPDWLAQLATRMAQGDVDGVGGRICLPDGESGGLAGAYMRRHRWYEQPPLRDGLPDFLLTGNALYSRRALEAVGGFDETFSAIAAADDTDLGRRIRAAGFRLAFCPQAVVVHPPLSSGAALLRAAFRYGVGAGYIAVRYPHDEPAARLSPLPVSGPFLRLQLAALHGLVTLVARWGAWQGARRARRRRATPGDPLIFATGGYVSAPVTLADVDGDGRAEIVAASDALYVWRLDGRLLPGFPARGGNFFASRPAVGDVNGDGQAEILVGCDDDALYAFDAAGQLLPGWPRPTGGDVYSSPALADVDGDGRPEVVVGSDDGGVYVWRGDGTLLPGWPRRTGGFVSASPVVADVDGDGRPEVVAGSWDGRVYVWRGDGSLLPGWPQATGHFVWGAAAVADVDGDGRPEVVVASERVYIWRGDGTPLPGWPAAMGSYGVGTPAVADVNGDGRAEVIAAADALYVWQPDGRLLPGFPARLGTYLWASPAVGDVDGDGRPEVVVGGWDGRLYALGAGGEVRAVRRTGGPLFASPALFHLPGAETTGVFIGSWDGRVYHFRFGGDRGKGRAERALPAIPRVREAGRFGHVPEFAAPFIAFAAPPARRAILRYRAHFETDWHPVPLVVHGGRLTGLIQPFLAGTRVAYYAEVWPESGRPLRLPAEGVFEYTVRPDWRARLSHRLRRLRRR